MRPPARPGRKIRPRFSPVARTLAVMLAIGLVGPVLSSAHEKGWEVLFSTIRATDEGGTETFRGSIFTETSFHPKEACIPNRPVRLYEVVPGADRLLASAKTNKFGAWSFSVPAADAERNLAVKLLRKVVRKDARHLHYCKVQTATIRY